MQCRGIGGRGKSYNETGRVWRIARSTLVWRIKGQDMQIKLWLIFAIMTAGTALSGCVPIVVGTGVALLVDEAIEQQQGGGDGLF